MTFSVNLAALRGLPPFLDRRARDLASAGSYVHNNTILRYGPGLDDILGCHERNVTVITTYLNAATRAYAQTDSTRLRRAIANYASADARAAARYDAALPTPPRTTPSSPVSAKLGPEIFNDRSNPASALLAPADHRADFPYHPSWYDLLSPSSVMRDVIWKLSGAAARLGILDRAYDPFEFFVEPYVGDWAGLLRCAEVFDHIADFLTGEAGEVHFATSETPEAWHGNAAGLCAANLSAFQASLSDGSAPLRDLAGAYRQVAIGVHDNCELMATVVSTLLDCASETLIDVGTGGLLGIYEAGSALHSLVRTLRVAIHIAGTLQDIVSAGFNITDEAMHRLGVLTALVDMPAMAGAQPAIPVGP